LETYDQQESRKNNIKLLVDYLTKYLQISTSYSSANSITKKIISRQILQIFSVVKDKKNDDEFIEKIGVISMDASTNCQDRQALFIFNLLQFIKTKNVYEINEISKKLDQEPVDRDEQLNLYKLFFEYIKNQVVYGFIIDQASKKCKEILSVNNQFSEEVEVYLNYLRIYANSLTENRIEHDLAGISNQAFYSDIERIKPKPEEIEKFISLFLSENKEELIDFIANFLTEKEVTSLYFLQKSDLVKKTKIKLSDFLTDHIDDYSYNENVLNIVDLWRYASEFRSEQIKEQVKEVIKRIDNKVKLELYSEFGDEQKQSTANLFHQFVLRKIGSRTQPPSPLTSPRGDTVHPPIVLRSAGDQPNPTSNP